MKKHNIFKIVGIAILAVVLLAWILPTGDFNGQYVEATRSTVGLFDLFTYPAMALSYFGYIIITVLGTGVFYAILNETGVYGKLLEKFKWWKNKESWLFAIIILLLSLLVSTTGLILLLILFIPLVIAIVLKLGYSRKVAALITVGSIATGLIGTTIGTNASLYVQQILELGAYQSILIKVGLFITANAALIFTVFEKMKKEGTVKEKNKDYFVKEVEKNKKSLIPFYVIFGLTVLVLILAYLPWNAMGVTLFDTITTNIRAYEIFNFALFGKLLGNVTAFGKWSITEGGILILVSAIILGLVYRVKFDDAFKSILKGLKKAAYPAMIMIFIYIILIIVTYHPFQLFIYNAILKLTSGFNVLTTGLTALVASVFNIELQYVAQSSLPYLASLITNTKLYPIIEILYHAMFGVATLFAPTSVILMGTLSYLGISYKEWLKDSWKLIVGLLILSLVVAVAFLLLFV